jgi:hypothetical protein
MRTEGRLTIPSVSRVRRACQPEGTRAMGQDDKTKPKRFAGGYTPAPNRVITDRRISPEAKMVWIWMRSRPPTQRDGTPFVLYMRP